jgi:hypothetical protein
MDTWTMARLLTLLIGLMSSLAFADDLGFPEFREKPRKYLNAHQGCILGSEGKEWVCSPTADELVVGDVSNRELTYWMWVIGLNGHQCNMTGQALRIRSGKYEYREGKCKLLLELAGDSMKVEDAGGNCTLRYCGSRASIGSIDFKVE